MHPPFQINSPHWNYQEDETQKKQTHRNKLTNSNIITSPVSQSHDSSIQNISKNNSIKKTPQSETKSEMDNQIKVGSEEERQFEDYQNQFEKIKFSNGINTSD